jgi:hypothetical protein
MYRSWVGMLYTAFLLSFESIAAPCVRNAGNKVNRAAGLDCPSGLRAARANACRNCVCVRCMHRVSRSSHALPQVVQWARPRDGPSLRRRLQRAALLRLKQLCRHSRLLRFFRRIRRHLSLAVSCSEADVSSIQNSQGNCARMSAAQ